MIFACNKYGNVCRFKDGKVRHWMKSLDVMPDVEQFEDIAFALGIVNDRKKTFIFKMVDPTFKETSGPRLQLKRMMADNPDLNVATLFLYAGHGGTFESRQVLLIDEYKKSTGFYEMLKAEYILRQNAYLYKNSWSLALFATCRENFDKPGYSDGLPGPKEVATAAHNERLKKAEEAKRLEEE